MGTVKAKNEVDLKPEVSGKIISMNEHLIPGGYFKKDEQLMAIDPGNYELAAKQLASEVAKAEAELQIELGRQRVAQKEYELLGEKVEAEELNLMLREPQLESTRASLDGARTKLEQAKLDLARTIVTSPFNATVISRGANLGSSVSPSTTLASLVGTDTYWVIAPIPVSQLKWIRAGNQASGEASIARIYDPAAWGPNQYRLGKVAGLTAKIEDQGRMAEVLIEVHDPLAMQKTKEKIQKLLLGSYVRAEIEGTQIENAAIIERHLIRNGDQLWIMDDQDQLDIRKVEIAFRAQDHVVVTGGIKAGERMVISNLPSPVQGMALRLAKNDTHATPPDAERKP
jgi:RND family efflux transporter MFP subunit